MKKLTKPSSVFYLVIGWTFVMIFLVRRPQEPAVFLLWIWAMIVIVFRIRFREYVEFLFVDILIFMAIGFYQGSLMLFVLPFLMFGVYKQRYGMFLVACSIGVLFVSNNLLNVLLVAFSLMVSFVVGHWKAEKDSATVLVDKLRNKQYRIEQEKASIMASSEELSRISVLSERDRIAQSLHDNLGHELTGALLALRAYETLHQEAKDDVSFISLKNRLEKSMDALKETVTQTKPSERYGFERLKEVIDDFEDCDVSFSTKGNVLSLGETHFYFLTSVVKEALTNVAKHANANHVSVEIEVQGPIVRCVVKNDGCHHEKIDSGFGLQYMRKRIEAINGTLTFHKSNIFRLICVIPFDMSTGGHDEDIVGR